VAGPLVWKRSGPMSRTRKSRTRWRGSSPKLRPPLPATLNQTRSGYSRAKERLRNVQPEDLTENSVLLGSPAQITEILKKVEAAGFDEVILYFNVGLKPGNSPLANDPPGALRLGKAGKHLWAEIGEIEQPADLRARRFGDDQRVRHSQGLQPGGKVRRLADDPALLRGTLVDQVADHGEAGGDAEPHAQILARRQLADRLDHREGGAHRPLGIVLMRSLSASEWQLRWLCSNLAVVPMGRQL